ncbi:hypothetical protein TNCV_4797061 [Trichonephila clavipes]|nr:hypothetical protein TNCV_4797061 [Trichonephila clavipes]
MKFQGTYHSFLVIALLESSRTVRIHPSTSFKDKKRMSYAVKKNPQVHKQNMNVLTSSKLSPSHDRKLPNGAKVRQFEASAKPMWAKNLADRGDAVTTEVLVQPKGDGGTTTGQLPSQPAVVIT